MMKKESCSVYKNHLIIIIVMMLFREYSLILLARLKIASEIFYDEWCFAFVYLLLNALIIIMNVSYEAALKIIYHIKAATELLKIAMSSSENDTFI